MLRPLAVTELLPEVKVIVVCDTPFLRILIIRLAPVGAVLACKFASLIVSVLGAISLRVPVDIEVSPALAHLRYPVMLITPVDVKVASPDKDTGV
jgi:hypothetical protein